MSDRNYHLEISRENYRTTRILEEEPAALGPNQVRFRIDHFKTLECMNKIGLNNFLKLKKLRLEHLEGT